MNSCVRCRSFAINHHQHGRDGSDGDLCDVCYWRKRAEQPASDAVETLLVQHDAFLRCAAHVRALPDAPKETPRPVDTNSRCTQDLRAAGKAYPRTCAECGLGPCHRYQKEPPHA